MNSLKENELKIIKKFCRKVGILNAKWKSELIDHLASSVEKNMAEGLRFDEAFEMVVSGLEYSELRYIDRAFPRSKNLNKYFRWYLTTAASLILMLCAFVVFGGDKPDIAPFRTTYHPEVSHYDELIGAFTYEISENLDICATASGRVIKILPQHTVNGLRYSLILNHKGTYQSLYIHLNHIEVEPGEQVTKGGVLGQAGPNLGEEKSIFIYKIMQDGQKVSPNFYY